eukprot:2087953-Alexandrium_andersonii.AAC.1
MGASRTGCAHWLATSARARRVATNRCAGDRNLKTSSESCRVVFKQLQISGVSCSSNSGKCDMAPGVRSLNCVGPGTASESLPAAPKGGLCTGGAFAELLEQQTPKVWKLLEHA